MSRIRRRPGKAPQKVTPRGNSEGGISPGRGWRNSSLLRAVLLPVVGFPLWLVMFTAIVTVWGLYILWSPRYLPFQDHPSHLYRYQALIEYGRPGSDAERHFIRNFGLAPNQLTDLIVVALGRYLSVSVDAAARVCLSLYVVGIPLALGWYLRVRRTQAPEYLLLGSVVTYTFFVMAGNENFILSVPLFLTLLALRAEGWAGRRRILPILGTLLATALYYCHMLSFGSAAVVVLVATLRARRGWRDLIREGVVFLPGGILLICYLLTLPRGSEASQTTLSVLAAFPSVAVWAKALADGIAPLLFQLEIPRGIAVVYYSALGVLLLRSVLAIRWKSLHPILVGILVLASTGLVLPEWFGVWRPGQRIALLALLAVTPFLPSGRPWRVVFSVAAVPLLIWMRTEEVRFVREGSAGVEMTVEPFQPMKLPTAHGGTVYPIVTQPYVQMVTCHRAFEYFHLKNGGMSPFHLMAADFALKFRNPIGDPRGLYGSSHADPASLAEKYDVVLLIGKNGKRGAYWLSQLPRHGWKEVAGNAMTGVFVRGN